MPYWCEHAACLESTQDYPSQAALDLHMQDAHDVWLTAEAYWPRQTGRCAAAGTEPEPEPEDGAVAASGRPKPRLVIAPGNGCASIDDANWYAWAASEFQKTGWFSEVILRSFPDPHRAREKIWLPFLQKQCKCDANTVLIGHSSGAVAAMRLLEQTPLLGAVLVSACHTDLGDAGERASGYYPRGAENPWSWSKIRENAGWIVQFHSTDDPFIPPEESRHVAASLKLGDHYHEFTNRSHFFTPFAELITVLGAQLGHGDEG